MADLSGGTPIPEGETVKIDENTLDPEQKKMLEEFRRQTSRKVSSETIKEWFKEIPEMDDEKFPAFMQKLINEDHDYYSTISAATCVALAAVKVFNKHHIFKDKRQGMKIANSIYASMTGIEDDPFRVFEFYSILDPACDGEIISMPKEVFAVLRTKAKELMDKYPDAPEALKKRWKQVANGKLPEPWIVRDFKE